MKIVSEVGRRLYLGSPMDEYTFKWRGAIPLGARLTVEWDDSVHECEEMKAYGRFLKRKAGIWFILRRYVDGESAVCEAKYCPGCGKDLT